MITIPAQLFVSVHVLLVVVHIILITTAYLIYLERKISAYIQDRMGPNRTGFDFGLPFLAPLKGVLGLGQSLADGMKFLLKEDYAGDRVDKALFTLAPMAIVVPALIGFAIIPWGGYIDVPTFEPLGLLVDNFIVVEGGRAAVAGADVGVGIIYLLGVASLGVYGVTLGGWASNNKYSFLGGLRATAQMISYEIPLALSILAVLLLVGSLMPSRIIDYQLENGWLVFSQPLAAVVFFIAILAEANRTPFDNAEAESELVGGYHTEYSAMRFALFFLAEYMHMITSSAFLVLLFFGGWDLIPFVNVLGDSGGGEAPIWLALIKFGVYFGKVVTVVCFMIVIRWTLPRLRYDQVMMVGWQGVIPLSLILVILTSVMVYFQATGILPMLVANVLLLVFLMAVQPKLISKKRNEKLPLYGSRFSPMPGERVSTRPTDAMALEDRPHEGTSAAIG